jgi:hypothetical protein
VVLSPTFVRLINIMGANENEVPFDATSSESGTVVDHEIGKPLKKSKLLLAVLYFGMWLLKTTFCLVFYQLSTSILMICLFMLNRHVSRYI